MYHLQEMGYDPANVKSVGISNQRETTIVWDKYTGNETTVFVENSKKN